jgi:FdrA protein
MKKLSKPVVALFLGSKPARAQEGNIWFASSLAEAARLAAMLASVEQIAASQAPQRGKQILGLYAGGTLAAEAAMLLAEHLGVETDAHHPDGVMLEAQGHRLIDLGDDAWTVGRPHPMIDPTTRSLEIENSASSRKPGCCW